MASPNPDAAAGLQSVAAAGAGEGGSSSSLGAVAAGEQAPRRVLAVRKERVCTAKERISRMPPCAAGKRSSIYRGVTRYPLPPPRLLPLRLRGAIATDWEIRQLLIVCAHFDRMAPWLNLPC